MKQLYHQTNRCQKILPEMVLIVMITTTINGKLSAKGDTNLDEHTNKESEMDAGEMGSSHIIHLYAVTDGKIIPMEEVEDDVFALKMIGDGYAIEPSSPTVVAPVSGKLIEVAEAKHAYYIETEEGLKVLVHVGLDTLLLNGEGFSSSVEKGSFVKQGDSLVTFDGELFKEKGYKTTIPVVVLDNQAREIQLTLHQEQNAKAGETNVLDIVFD